MNTLKPCPFCPDGGDVQLVTFTDGVDDVVHCHTCDRILKHKIWQTRPIEDDLCNRIAELEAENIRLGIEYQRMRLALGDIAINCKRALNESPTDHLTARLRQERQDDKWILEVQE